MPERPRTAVPVGLLHSGRRCRHSAAPAFGRQLLALPRYRLNTYGRRAFSVAGPQSGTLSRISSVIRPSVQTVSDVCLKCTCSLDTSAFSALEVLDNNRALEIYLLTYLRTAQRAGATAAVSFDLSSCRRRTSEMSRACC